MKRDAIYDKYILRCSELNVEPIENGSVRDGQVWNDHYIDILLEGLEVALSAKKERNEHK